MESRIIEKIIEVDGRRFVIAKFTAFTGIKIGKMLTAKVLPLIQTFTPALADLVQGDTENVWDKLGDERVLESIANMLDLIKGEDLDYIMRSALQQCVEDLKGGRAPVMRSDGTYGVEDVEYDPLLVLRLVIEAIIWGLGDFFSGKRWASVLKPLLPSSLLNA